MLTSLSRYIYLYLSEMKQCRGLSLENVWEDPQRLINCRLERNYQFYFRVTDRAGRGT